MQGAKNVFSTNDSAPALRLTRLLTLGLVLILFFFAPTVRILAAVVTAPAFADFEGDDYGAWIVEGTAFGAAPARGALPGQMAVEGFQGRGLANSFTGGDNATGRLTSPPFKIERKFITFLIGGGGFASETCLNLIVEGKVVRTATGSNAVSGGSERLAPAAWEVAEFVGREARLVIVDERKGGWGHINVDQIAFVAERGETPLAAVPAPPPQERTQTLRVESDFLQLPLVRRADQNRAGLEKFTLEANGQVLRVMHIELAAPDAKPDWVYSYDVREFRGRDVTLRYKSRDAGALERLTLSNQEIVDPQAYAGPHRPRFHFSPRLGWMNDINGSYYADGLYHLFYQANPLNLGSGAGFDMHWGHSVSRDLLHWEEWPVALFPDGAGQCYSGTTVVTPGAVPGLTTQAAPVIFYAATAPFSQHLATTPDGGRTWQRFAGNPVVKNIGDGDRDPKVVWHEASQHYVMVLYVGGPDTYRLLRSKDLVNWEPTQSLPGWFECPEFFPVKSTVTGEELWLLYGCHRTAPGAPKPFNSNSCYQLGRFDGKTFTPVGEIKNAHEGPNFYGALVFNHAPQGRQIMMGWTRGTARPPGEPFNQFASVPLELTLQKKNREDTLCFEPVRELSALRGTPLLALKNISAADAQAKLAALQKDAPLDAVVRFRSGAKVSFRLRGTRFTYDASARTVQLGRQTKVIHPEATVDARFLVDRGLIESFWNGGEASYCAGSLHTADGPALAIEGDAQFEELIVYPLANIWK